MKMQGFVISGWSVSFTFFSPLVPCILTRIGQKNTLVLAVIMEITAALCFAIFSFVSDPWAFWVLNFIGRLIEGMADTTTAITITTIISCEFTDKADYYYGFVQLAWSGGYIIGPMITLILHDSLHYTGLFLFLACLIALGALVPSVCMLPSRLNKKESETTDGDTTYISYCDFFKSFRSVTILVVSLLGITPLIYIDGPLSTRLVSLGCTEA